MDRLVGKVTPLDQLARWLNAIPRLPRPYAVAWRKAAAIITTWRRGSKAKQAQAREEINAWSKQHPVIRTLSYNLSVGIESPDPEAAAIHIVLCQYFEREDRDRLKQCSRCDTWFVDKTRPGNMLRCSRGCTDKWWTVGRRREAAKRRAKR